MTLTPELEKIFEEKTKKVSLEFHNLGCCQNNLEDIGLIRECLEKGRKYINHFENYYLPKIEASRSDMRIATILDEINLQRSGYSGISIEMDEISVTSSIEDLKEFLRIICNYIKEIESKLTELGFKY